MCDINFVHLLPEESPRIQCYINCVMVDQKMRSCRTVSHYVRGTFSYSFVLLLTAVTFQVQYGLVMVHTKLRAIVPFAATPAEPIHPWVSKGKNYPGRFQKERYNVTVEIEFAKNKHAIPYERIDCAAGLKCYFSDRSWHETGWLNQKASFINSAQLRNIIAVSMEAHSRFPFEVPSGGGFNDTSLSLAGFATSDLRSDIPITSMDHGGLGASYRTIESYYRRTKSNKISKWKILYMQSNCDTVMSGRSFVIEKLIERGLVDSFGRCNKNNAELPLEHSPSDGLNGGMSGNKTALMERYAFVAAFENSYYPGYATEKN